MLTGISQARRRMAVIQGVSVNQFVKSLRLDPGSYVLPNEVHQLRIKLASLAHELSICLRESDFWTTTNHGFGRIWMGLRRFPI